MSVTMPRRQKSAPTSPPFQRRVSAALRSSDAGEGRVSLGDPGCCLGDGAPASVGGCCLMAVLVQRSETIKITCRLHFSAERFVGPPKSAVSLQGKGTRKAATTSKTRNTNIAPSRSSPPAFLNTFSTPPRLSPSVFVLQLDFLRPSRTCSLALGTLARLLACRLILAVPGHPFPHLDWH